MFKNWNRRKSLLWIFVLLPIIGIGLYLSPHGRKQFIGSADLELRFLLTDAETSQPLENVTI